MPCNNVQLNLGYENTYSSVRYIVFNVFLCYFNEFALTTIYLSIFLMFLSVRVLYLL